LTLVEVLTVVLILLILGAGLVPQQVGRFQRASRQSTCVRQLQRIGQAQALYAIENDDHIPGLNTSGVAMRVLNGSPPSAYQNADLPVQPQDWMTPLLRLEMPMPVSRAERLRLAMEEYSCPVRPREEAFLFGNPPDLAEFNELSPWEASSYLMPIAFQYWGAAEANTVLAYNAVAPSIPVLAQRMPPSWEVTIPSFSSQVSEVGPPSSKVFVADGTRFISSFDLTIDIGFGPSFYGVHGSNGAWRSGSTEYGVEGNSENWSGQLVCDGSISNGRNLRYSYRHDAVGDPRSAMDNHGSINAVFYDGHVESLDDEESREISLWYPTGGQTSLGSECLGMTNLPAGYVIP
jgi:prepilin-type processing-associated H-X9-DG protein